MGGFGNVLGAAAGGFSQAHQLDLQRQFENEQNMRGQALGYLSKVALDETALPGARNAATQAILGITQVPMGKFNQKEAGKWLGSVLQPPTPPQTMAQFQPGAAPGLNLSSMPTPPVPIGATGPVPLFGRQTTPPAGGQSPVVGTLPAGAPPPVPVNLPPMPQPPVSLMSAAQPGGVFMTPEQKVQYAAGLAGGTAGGTLAAQLEVHRQIADRLLQDPRYAEAIKSDPLMQEILVSSQLGTTVPYGMYRMGMGGKTDTTTVGNAMQDPEWAQLLQRHPELLDHPETTISLQRDNAGRPMTITPVTVPSLVPKTTAGVTTTPGGLTTTRTQTVTPRLGTPPSPPSRGGATAVPAGRGGGGTAAARIPAAVSAEMDNLMMYGFPAGKLNDAQALAEQQLRKQGIDPQIAATNATRTMADKGRAILPLIERARQLIAQDPNALGPLAGRWSELEKKFGSLEGAPKELAGTLISIYSMAGGLHGWRAIQVADEFQNTYGGLSSSPGSLTSGLDALQNTANSVITTGYPGAPQGKGGTPTTPSKGKKITDFPTI